MHSGEVEKKNTSIRKVQDVNKKLMLITGTHFKNKLFNGYSHGL